MSRSPLSLEQAQESPPGRSLASLRFESLFRAPLGALGAVFSVGISGRLTLLVSGLLLAVGAAAVAYFPARMDGLARRGAEDRALGIAALLSSASEPAVEFDDSVAAATLLRSLEAATDARYAILLRSDGTTLASWGAAAALGLASPLGAAVSLASTPGLLHVSTPVRSRVGHPAVLRIGLGVEALEAAVRRTRHEVVGLSVLTVLIGLIVVAAAAAVVVRPLRRLTAAVRGARDVDALTAIAGLEPDRADEVGDLSRAFASLGARVQVQQERIVGLNGTLEARVAEVGAVNATLAERVGELNRAQGHLVASDRRAAIGTLAAGVAHEINNPLAFVLSNVQYVAEEMKELSLRPLPERGAALTAALPNLTAALVDAEEGSDRVRQIVRGLRVFARSDEGAPCPLNLRTVLETAVNLARSGIKQHARLEMDLRDAPWIFASEVRLGQVFLNLLINAAQACSGREEDNLVTVRLSAQRGGALVEIEDTGCGIPEENLHRVFDPFFTTKDIGVGTGLGLYIVQGIVTGLGGTIAVRSTVGKGTGFSVWLPSDTAKLASNPGLRRVAPPELRRGRVLVIDDEPAIGVAIERLLGKAHEVVALTDPVEALARLRRGERFDLILCDVMMPRLSGPELFESVEKDAADAAGSFFFLSGGAFNPSAHDFVEKHRKRLVEKPATAARLRELLHARLS